MIYNTMTRRVGKGGFSARRQQAHWSRRHETQFVASSADAGETSTESIKGKDT